MHEPSSTEPSRPLRVFVLEDDPETLKLLSVYLETLGHTVTSSFTVAYARERLAAMRFDVLIADISLPDGDAWELMHTVKFFHPLYAMALTGNGSDDARAKSKAAGFRHHLLKPFRISELDAALREATREANRPGAMPDGLSW